MNRGKIKNFIIIVLLIFDAILLVILMQERLESAAARRQLRSDVTQVLSENGIEVASGVDIIAEGVNARSTLRDMELEKRLVERVIGSSEVTDEGGNIFMYFGSRGRASFRGTGEFAIEPASGSVLADGDPLACAERLMRRMGMDYADELTELTESPGSASVTFVCELGGMAVYNCRVSFSFANDSLVIITGRRAPDRSSEEGRGAVSAVTVLLRFVDLVRENGYICSSITALEEGYIIDASASGAGTLTPVWRISTDTGVHYISGADGSSEIII